MASPPNSFLIPPDVMGTSKGESRNWPVETRKAKEIALLGPRSPAEGDMTGSSKLAQSHLPGTPRTLETNQVQGKWEPTASLPCPHCTAPVQVPSYDKRAFYPILLHLHLLYLLLYLHTSRHTEGINEREAS